MSILIASDCQASVVRLQQALTQFGKNAPPDQVVSVNHSLSAAMSLGNKLQLIVFVLTDDRRRAFQQIHSLKSQSRLAVVVMGPAIDPGCILDALNHGADHFIDQDGDLVGQLEHYVRRHQRGSAFPVEGKPIAIISPCGGSGVSVIASNLAAILAQEHQDCVLMDLNPGRGDQASLFNLSPRHCLNDICENLESLDQNILDQSLTSHRSGVRVLAANEEVLDLPHAYDLGFRKICRLAKSMYPRTVIDHSLSSREEYAGILSECDSILIVIRMDFTSLKNLEYLLIHLENLNISMDRIHLVANRIGSPHELPLNRIKSFLGRPIQLTIPDSPHVVNVSVNCGTPAVLESSGSEFARSIRKIAETVCPVAGDVEGARKQLNVFRFLKSKLLARSSSSLDQRMAAPVH
ncbi:MAG TPA: hypothetical protein VNQ76_16420 [Planctomicrobium sp.]|nr:hypothetical protein [Planctomicrobium sp.]